MPDRPNLLVFLTDDHGQWAANCYGTPELKTPAMDWLADTGCRMTRAFTPCPVCSPARASFFTGRTPSQHGIHDWIREPDAPYRDHPGLAGQTTLPMLLRDAGYETALSGKWHCGESWTPKAGFDHWFGYGRDQYPHRGDITLSDHGTPIDCRGYQSQRFTDEAIRFVQHRDRERPFFLFVGLVDTHSPFRDHPERLVNQYRKGRFDSIPFETYSDAHGTPRARWHDDPAKAHEELAQYFAAVTMIDDQLGRVLDTLEGDGVLDDTLVLYTGDHGHMNGHHGLMCKGNTTVPQNFIDESILVPALLRWPGHAVSGKVVDEPVDHCDTWATLLDVAGVELTPEQAEEIHSPGRSYLPLLRGDADIDWRDAYFGEYGNARCIRTESHKLIRRYPGPNGRFGDEFYDLEADPRETTNRIADAEAQAVIDSLSVRLDAYFAEYSIRERSGVDIASQPRCNPNEPWRFERPGDAR